MIEDNRKCNMCNIDKPKIEFHSKTYNCKQCTSIKKNRKYKQSIIEERKLYRDKLKMVSANDGVTDEEFNKHFIPFEKFEIMKNLPELFSFHQCSTIRKLDIQQNKSDYNNKYFLDVAFIEDKKRKSYYRVHII